MQVCYYLNDEEYDTVNDCTELPYVGETYDGFEITACHETKYGWYRCTLRIPRDLDAVSKDDMVMMLKALRHIF